METKRLCLIYQEEVAKHSFGPTHPLRPERLTLYLNRLHQDGLIERLGISILDPDIEVSDEEVLAVHDISLVNQLRYLSLFGGQLDADTPVPIGTYKRAKLQAGGFLYGAELVLQGKFGRALQMGAFGGHHAMRRHGRITFGFCYLNQEAIVIRSLQKRGYIKKALILDCDCHHGNGIQDIFYDDPSVLYISLHQDPRTLYPGIMGFIGEVGEGAGKGYNVNIPLPPRTAGKSYLHALSAIFPPLAYEFKPDIILFIINADTHFRDPLTNMGLDLSCYPLITDLVVKIAKEVCGGKMLVKLGGGYNVEVAVTSACWITARLAEYYEYQPQDPYGPAPEEPLWVTQRVEQVIAEVKRALCPYWQSLQD